MTLVRDILLGQFGERFRREWFLLYEEHWEEVNQLIWESMTDAFKRIILRLDAGDSFDPNFLNGISPLLSAHDGSVKSGVYFGLGREPDSAYIGRALDLDERRAEHAAALLDPERGEAHYRIAAECLANGGTMEYYAAVIFTNTGRFDLNWLLGVTEFAMLLLAQTARLDVPGWETILAACKTRRIPSFGLLGCNSTLCLDGPIKSSVCSTIPVGPQDPYLRTLVWRVQYLRKVLANRAVELYTQHSGASLETLRGLWEQDAGRAKLKAQLRRSSDLKKAELRRLLSESGYVFRPAGALTSASNLILILSGLDIKVTAYFANKVNRRLQAAGRAGIAESPEPGKEPLLRAQLKFSSPDSRKDLWATSAPFWAPLLHGMRLELSVVPLSPENPDRSSKAVNVQTLFTPDEAICWQNTASLLWPLVPDKEARVRAATDQINEERIHLSSQVSAELRSFVHGQRINSSGISNIGNGRIGCNEQFLQMADSSGWRSFPGHHHGVVRLNIQGGAGYRPIARDGFPFDDLSPLVRLEPTDYQGSFARSHRMTQTFLSDWHGDGCSTLRRVGFELLQASAEVLRRYLPWMALWQTATIGFDRRSLCFDVLPGLKISIDDSQAESLGIRKGDTVEYLIDLVGAKSVDDLRFLWKVKGKPLQGIRSSESEAAYQFMARIWYYCANVRKMDEAKGLLWRDGLRLNDLTMPRIVMGYVSDWWERKSAARSRPSLVEV